MKSVYEYTVALADQPGGLEEGNAFLDFSEKLYEAFGGGIEVQMSHGALVLEVEAEAESMVEALLNGLDVLHSLGLQAARFGPEEYVNAADIAERLHLSRERVNQMRQAGKLPSPVMDLSKRSPRYRWAEVAAMLDDSKLSSGTAANAEQIEKANAALVLFGDDLRRVRAELN